MPKPQSSSSASSLSYAKRLLNQMLNLFRAKKETEAQFNYEWLLHFAERGLLTPSEIKQLIELRTSILPFYPGQNKINLCERLLAIAKKASLETEQITLNEHLIELYSQPHPWVKPPVLVFSTTPQSDTESNYVGALSCLTDNRRLLSTSRSEDEAPRHHKNTQNLNRLEVRLQFNWLVPYYLEQLKAYQQEDVEKINALLHGIVRFAKRLQAQALYTQAHYLYYEILLTLSTKQEDCLSAIDERCLLEGLCLLQETWLAKEDEEKAPRQLPVTHYFWSENWRTLQEWRAVKKILIEEQFTAIDSLRHDLERVKRIEALQQVITAEIKAFFENLFKQAESLLGEPPFDYCLIALGSMARDDATPFSDVESVLLVEKPCPEGSIERHYFECLWKLVAFQVSALGESHGLHIDPECHPLMTDDLINTPEGVIHAYGLRNITTEKTGNGRLALTLLHSTIVYEHESKAETLWETYHRLLTKRLSTETTSADASTLLRHQKAEKQLQQHLESFRRKPIPDANAAPSTAKAPTGVLAHLREEANEEPGCFIKRDFLGPLAYLLADLNVYHHLDKTNLADILDALVAKRILDSSFAQHCRAAIAELNLFRLSLHIQNNQAEDKFPADLPQHQQERLKHLWLGLLKPLYAVDNQLTQITEPTHPVFDVLSRLIDEATPPTQEKQEGILTPLLHYLLYAQSPDNPYSPFIDVYHRLPVGWRPLFLKRIEAVTLWPLESRHQQETLANLEAQANPDGWQPRMEQEKRAWEATLLSLLELLDPDRLPEAIASKTLIVYMPSSTAPHPQPYRFKPSIYEQLFNPDGTLKPKDPTLPGRHHLLSILHEGRRFWFKFMPEQPGTEFAIAHLERHLGGRGIPMTQIIKLVCGKELGMAVQVSEHVPGTTLAKTLVEEPEYITQIDIASFTQTLLRVLLTNPEDDKGDDYFLIPTDDGKHFRLIRIDNERAYYQPDAPEEGIIRRFTQARKLEVKSALYCLNQMQQTLSPDTLEAFLRLDPVSLLDHWMQELKEEHNHYRALFTTDDEIRRHFRHPQPGPSTLGVPMGSGLAEELLTRLESMQEVIRLKGVHAVKGLDLLRAVQPRLADYYEARFRTHPVPESPIEPPAQAALVSHRLTMLDALYDITPDGHRQSRLPTIKAASRSLRLKQDLTENDVMRCIRSEALSPQQSLEELHQLESTRLKTVKEGLLQETPTSIQAFQRLRVRLRLLVLKGIIDGITATSILSINQQQHVLKAMAGTPFHSLSLVPFQETLTDTLLKPILIGAHKHLLVLNIGHCHQLTQKTFEALAKHCPHLESLIVHDIKRKKPILSLQGLSLPNLKVLIMNRCEPLTQLALQAPLLERLETADCPQLDILSTGSLTLITVDVSNNPLLTESGLEHLSRSPFRLRQLTVLNCPRLPYPGFRMAFPFLGTQPLSHLSPEELATLQEGLSQRFDKHRWTGETCPEVLKEKWVTSG